MSDFLTSGPDEADNPRRRATWMLLALALIALLVVAITVLLVRTSGSKHPDAGLAGNDETTSPGGRSIRPLSTAPATPTRPPSRPPKPVPTSTANPCPSAAPCTVPGDSGQAVTALNNFRVSHGRPAVPGAITAQAQECSLREGNGPSCVPHYSWEPVPTQNGAAVISLIAGRGNGTQWLLDPAMKSFSIGWAYTPGPGGGPGHYQCAVLKTT